MIDTHCHLSYPDFAGDLDEMLARAVTAGVTGFITVATDRDDWRRSLDLAATRPAVRVALGLHPNEASNFTPALADELRATAAGDPKVVAIGETGLDWYREQCPREKQYESFRAHLRISAELKKPFVLHCREAEEEMFAKLDAFQQESGAPLRGVWHCFTSTVAWAERAAAMGLYFSVGGIVTYPKADGVRAAVAGLPADRLLLETDCPFLPPQGWRGKRNEPSYLTKVIATLGEIRGVSPAEIDRITTANARTVFGA